MYVNRTVVRLYKVMLGTSNIIPGRRKWWERVVVVLMVSLIDYKEKVNLGYAN